MLKSFSAAILSAFLLMPSLSFAQAQITTFSSSWKIRTDLFRSLPNTKGEICFLGDSITHFCEWKELTGNPHVINRGISSDTAWGIMLRLDEVLESKPAKIFLMVGTNELSRGKTPAEVRDKIAEVLTTIQTQSPKTKIYLQSVLPVVDGRVDKYTNANIDALNPELMKLAAEKKVTFINLNPLFKDENGQLKANLTEDGLHLKSEGYQIWLSQIRQYVK